MSRKPTRQQENREEMMRESLKNNKLNSVSVFQWQQKLFEQDVDRNTLIQSAKYMTPSDFEEVLEERRVMLVCGYPLCSNPIKKTIKSTISKLKSIECHQKYHFCSTICHKSTVYFTAQLNVEPLYMRKDQSDVCLYSEEAFHNSIYNLYTKTDAKQSIREFSEQSSDRLKDSNLVNIKETNDGSNTTGFNREIDTISCKFNLLNTIEGFTPKINPSQSSQLYSSNTKQPIVAIPLDFKPRLTRPHDSPSTCSQHSKSEAEDWFDDSDEEDVDIHLTRFGRIWTFLDHLVTPATKQLLSPTHLAGVLFDPSKKTDPSQMVVRKQVFSKSLLRVYAQWRREYGLESITNTVFGLVDTFWFRDNSIVSELKDEYAVCLIVMRVLNKKTAFKLKSEEWHEMAGKTEFGMTEINTFVNIFY